MNEASLRSARTNLSHKEGVRSSSLPAFDTRCQGYLAVMHSQTKWHRAKLMESGRADHNVLVRYLATNLVSINVVQRRIDIVMHPN